MNTIIKMKDIWGFTVYINSQDLNKNIDYIPLYTKDGKRSTNFVGLASIYKDHLVKNSSFSTHRFTRLVRQHARKHPTPEAVRLAKAAYMDESSYYDLSKRVISAEMLH